MPHQHWPLDKIKKNIEQHFIKQQQQHSNDDDETHHMIKNTRFLVLLTTGAMNPIHKGHTSSLHHCAKGLTKLLNNNNNNNNTHQKTVIVGAFISPSGDKYLQGKFASKPNDFFIPGSVRHQACVKATENDPLLSVGSFEVSLTNRWADFPEVCSDLQSVLNEKAGEIGLSCTEKNRQNHENNENNNQKILPQFEVVYCCGSDHFVNCQLERGVLCRSPSSSFSVRVAVTPRGTDDFEMLKQRYCSNSNDDDGEALSMTDMAFLLHPVQNQAIADMSSTKIRGALKVLMGGVIDPQVVAICLQQSQ